MKVKDLIQELNKIEDKELPVCVYNMSVSDISIEPAYYDGSLQVVIMDDKGRPVSGKYKREGSKVQINVLKFSELIWDRDFPIDYSELDEERQKDYKENHAKIRQKAKDCDYELAIEAFVEFVNKKASTDMTALAKEFFNEHLSPYDPISDDIPFLGESYYSRRMKQWDKQIKIEEGKILYITCQI